LEPLEKDKEIRKKLWETHSELIRQFISLRPSYEQLASEAAYILKTRLQEAKIEFSAVTCRAKTLDSSLEKLDRKTYGNLLEKITDLAGVRIVYLYSNDFERIREIISKEFEVIEIVDKRSEQGVDKFGYVAVHYIVHLGKKSSGARYDHLKPLKCEIQVRTVLQDAWAIINHQLTYKREQEVLIPLIRKVNLLAGLLETADNQFNQVHLESEQFRQVIESSLATDQGLNQEINVDTVVAFLKHRFPDAERESSEKYISKILDNLDREKYKTLKDLKNLLDKKPDEIEKHKGMVLKNGKPSWSAAFILASVLEFERYGVPLD
jgi:putative GTP pyrophosphokinase